MPLEGNVREFGLADVLQFIAGNQKAGVLQLTSKNDKASIAFDNGKITGAVYGRQGKQDQLQNYLLRAKKVEEGKLESILKIQNETGIPLGDLLLKEGLMSQDEMDSMVTFKIQEVMDEVFTWADARYKFNPDERLYQNSRSRAAIPAESLLLETLRRKDEWPAISKALSSDGIILRIIPEVEPEGEMGPDAQHIYNLIDGIKTIGQLIDKTYLGRFRTFSGAYSLLQLNMAEKIHTPELEIRPTVKAPAGKTADARRLIATVSIAAGVLLLCLSGLAAFKVNGMIIKGDEGLGTLSVKYQKTWLVKKIEVYKITSGSYPENLSLVNKNNQINQLFVYQKTDEASGYRLELK